MKLYRYDTKTATVIETQGNKWPEYDSDGVQIYENTHFKTKHEAWDAMMRDAEAGVYLAADRVKDLRQRLAEAEARAATCAIEWAAVRDALPVVEFPRPRGTTSAELTAMHLEAEASELTPGREHG